MTVRVRLFAALREAAGTTATTVDAATVDQALAQLRARYGSQFSRWLEVASVVVDGDVVDRGAPLSPGSEMVLLPPFSGG